MTSPRAIVLRTAGTNCNHETERALRLAGAKTETWHLHRLLDEPATLESTDILVIPGGFSYGDDVAAGRVWGLELRRGLADALTHYVGRGGLLLGICNGFQVLVESGLFREPGLTGARDLALTNNRSNRFECRWVTLESVACACPWVVSGERMPVPVAHAEGRFAVADPETLERLVANRQVAFRYVSEAEGSSDSSGEVPYPANPNGSVGDIAGICDPTGRVLGLMPHPERNLDPWSHPLWTRLGERSEGEGLAFYRRMVQTAAGQPVG